MIWIDPSITDTNELKNYSFLQQSLIIQHLIWKDAHVELFKRD